MIALVQGGAPDDAEGYRLVEDKGVLLWVDRSLRFRGEGIDLDVGYTRDGMVVYATNFLPGP